MGCAAFFLLHTEWCRPAVTCMTSGYYTVALSGLGVLGGHFPGAYAPGKTLSPLRGCLQAAGSSCGLPPAVRPSCGAASCRRPVGRGCLPPSA